MHPDEMKKYYIWRKMQDRLEEQYEKELSQQGISRYIDKMI